jgi:hypothetical protein
LYKLFFIWFTEIHKPKLNNSTLNDPSDDDPTYSKIDECQNQPTKEDPFLIRSNSDIDDLDYAVPVETGLNVKSGLTNIALENDDDIKDNNRIGQNESQSKDVQAETENKKQSKPDENQCILIGNCPGSPPTPRESSFASSFDFGPPLSTWSDSQRSSSPESSASHGDLEYVNLENDDAQVNSSSSSASSEDDTSIASYSINVPNTLNQLEDPGLKSNDSPENNSDFDQFLDQTDNVNSMDEANDLKENVNQLFETDSEGSSSENECMEYDLITGKEKDVEGVVVFLRLKKIENLDSIRI